jgi:outer membrane receptor protein involved in Fe transport
LGLTVNGQGTYPSETLDENQRELTHYVVLSWQHADGPLDWQTSLTGRYSSLTFSPDVTGDLLYNGIAQDAYKRDVAFGAQSDAAYKVNATHTLRAGFYVQHDTATSDTTSQILYVDNSGNPIGDTPQSIVDNASQTQWIESLYLQDEWQAFSALTINYGLRLDHINAYTSGGQLSPRLNTVWRATPGTTVHAGYSRYFTPAPFELVGSETISKFLNTTAAPEVATDDPPVAERADYYDIGVEQRLWDRLTLGVDSYYRRSKNLIDEGQFGAPIILTPFNYLDGWINGIEFTANYAGNRLSAYGNLAFQSAHGRSIESSQFNFSQDDLNYIATHDIHLDHEQRVTASAGASYLRNNTRLSADFLLGTGLRADLVLPDGSAVPNGAHLPTYAQFNVGASQAYQFEGSGALTVRFDVINVFDKVYEIRNGTGVGVGAPQFGPRRGIFLGFSKAI